MNRTVFDDGWAMTHSFSIFDTLEGSTISSGLPETDEEEQQYLQQSSARALYQCLRAQGATIEEALLETLLAATQRTRAMLKEGVEETDGR